MFVLSGCRLGALIRTEIDRRTFENIFLTYLSAGTSVLAP